MNKLLLLSALVSSGLAQAAEAIPDVVKHFSEQQDIKIIKKLDAPAARQPGLDNIRIWA
jgi:thiol:disulfide interchange protein DsbG